MGVMLVCGRPVILLLFITSLVFHSSEGMTDDYEQHDDITTVSPSSSSATSEMPELNPCNYDMCVEQEQTCQQLAEDTNCLCPGLSGIFSPPSPPRLTFLTQQDDKGVVVQWCAPTSILTHYIVWVKGNDKAKDKETQVEERKRAVVLKDVEAGALVCVEAVNKGGGSKDDQSCATFEPQSSDSGLALKLGITGGVVGLILLLILALLLWRHKTRQKSMARTETEGVL